MVGRCVVTGDSARDARAVEDSETQIICAPIDLSSCVRPRRCDIRGLRSEVRARPLRTPTHVCRAIYSSVSPLRRAMVAARISHTPGGDAVERDHPSTPQDRYGWSESRRRRYRVGCLISANEVRAGRESRTPYLSAGRASN